MDDEFSEEFVDKIIAAVGSNVGNPKSRHDFAEHVVGSLEYDLDIGSDKEKIREFYQQIKLTAQSLENSLKAYRSSLYTARTKLHSINELTPFFGDTYAKNCDLRYLINYFERYNSELAKVRIAKKKPGANKPRSDYVARAVARYYRQFFKGLSTGRGSVVGTLAASKAIETPYDRVCGVIESFCNIPLSAHVRKKAVDSVNASRK